MQRDCEAMSWVYSPTMSPNLKGRARPVHQILRTLPRGRRCEWYQFFNQRGLMAGLGLKGSAQAGQDHAAV